MNLFEVILPQLGVNDQSVRIVEWLAGGGKPVERGQVLARVETSKAVFDLECEAAGYCYPLASPGEEVPIRSVVALILPEPDEAAVSAYRETHPVSAAPSPRFTRRAQELVERHSLDASRFPLDRIIREQDVLTLVEGEASTGREAETGSHRVAIYGASQGGLAVLECLLAGGAHTAVAFLDDDPQWAGQHYHGLPVWPGANLSRLRKEGVTAVATHIARSDLRLAFREAFRAAGLVYLNTIHPRAVVASSVRMGEGNLIKAGAIVDAHVDLGDCCIIDNGVILPHHNRIGDGCHLAPGACFGGDCTVESGSVIGIGATVSARIHIGRNVIVGAGACVTRDVPDYAVVEGQPARIVGERR